MKPEEGYALTFRIYSFRPATFCSCTGPGFAID